MIKQIWKLQRPLFASDGQYGQVLAYTEDRTQTALITLDGAAIENLFGDEAKIYVNAHVKKGNLVVDEIIEQQDW